MCCKKSMMERAVITPRREPWRPKSSKQGIIGRPSKAIAQNTWRNAWSAKSSARYTTQRRAPQHHIALVVFHMGNGHHQPFLARQRSDETPTGRSGLFNKVDRGRVFSLHIGQKCPKLCLEKHCVSVRATEHNRVGQWTTIYRLRDPNFLWWPWHQIRN